MPGKCQGPHASCGSATSLVESEAANAAMRSGIVSESEKEYAWCGCTCPVVRRQRSKEQGMR